MKTKLLFGLLLTSTMLFCFSSCKEKEDELDVINQTSLTTFRATTYRSAFTVDENVQTMATTEYCFVSQDTIKKTVGFWGNGVQYAYTPSLYTYRQGAFGEKNVGQYYTLISVENGEEKVIKFENNAFHDGDNVCDLTFSTINSIATIDEDFSNTSWTIDTMVFWTKDVEKILYFDTIKHIEKVEGKKQWVIDTVIPHKGLVKDTLGPKYIVKGNFSFVRNAEFNNSGAVEYYYAAYEKDTTIKEPTEKIEYNGDMTWCITSVSSAKKFTVMCNFPDGKEYLPLYDFSVTRNKETGEVTEKTIMFNEFPLKWVK